jgi:uncharacterized protein YecE (DUF72 family)
VEGRVVTVRVGTSGWQYRDWRSSVYSGRPQRDWLSAYAERFDTVEVNSSFYRLPARETFARWAEVTPSDFRFAVKMSRYLTHFRRLREPVEPVQRFLDRASGLGDKLAVSLVQLPPDLHKDMDLLEQLLAVWPSALRLTIEFRHDTWFDADTAALLQAHDVAACLTDRQEEPTSPVWRTADWWYLRMHEGAGTPHPCYRPWALTKWQRRLSEAWSPADDGFAYFNNDHGGCAVRDATEFRHRLVPATPVRRTKGAR